MISYVARFSKLVFLAPFHIPERTLVILVTLSACASVMAGSLALQSGMSFPIAVAVMALPWIAIVLASVAIAIKEMKERTPKQ